MIMLILGVTGLAICGGLAVAVWGGSRRGRHRAEDYRAGVEATEFIAAITDETDVVLITPPPPAEPAFHERAPVPAPPAPPAPARRLPPPGPITSVEDVLAWSARMQAEIRSWQPAGPSPLPATGLAPRAVPAADQRHTSVLAGRQLALPSGSQPEQSPPPPPAGPAVPR